MQLIFVYGSLKRGYRLHHLLQAQPFIAEAHTCPLYRLYDLGDYPGLVAADDGVAVFGEVYCVDAVCLRQLDAAEGVAEGLYERRRVRLQGDLAAAAVDAWFYAQSCGGCRDCGSRWPPQG